MELVGWAAVVGALVGWLAGDFSAIGFVLGGLGGAALGTRLRLAVRREATEAVRAALGESDDAAPLAAPAREPDVAAEPPARTPARIRTAPAADPIPISEEAPVPAPVPATAPAPVMAPAAAMAPAAMAYTTASPWTPPERTERVDPVEALLGKARDWLLGGNTIVRAGLAVLFVGLVFLARYAANAGLLPIEVRLAVIAGVGLVLLLVGLRQRLARPPFALSLQGAGVAVLYLVVFAAARAYGVLPAAAAFGFMILFAGLGCALALLQNSLTLALASFLGGFAVPVLLGGRSETPLGLFGYLTVLNLAILVIAWRKSWRPLNLLGFAATFLLAAAWGFSAYQDQHFLLCELFLALSVAIYLAAAMLYAHNTPGRLGGYADATLLFGTALAGFGLQAGLVEGRPFAAAWSALAFGAVYLSATALALRRRDPAQRFLAECLLAIGTGFVTLAVPLALSAEWTSATWALEGAGAVWVGARQARWVPRLFGLGLQALAALVALGSVEPNIAALPLANPAFLVPMLVALPALFTAWLLREPLPHNGSSLAQTWAPGEFGLRNVWFLGGFALVCLAILREVGRLQPGGEGAPLVAVLSGAWQLYAAVLGILLAMGLSQQFGRRTAWRVATWPARLALPALAAALVGAIALDRNVLYAPDWLFWAAAIPLTLWQLRHLAAERWTAVMHLGAVLLGTALLADALGLGIERAALWDTAWAGVTFLASATAILFALTHWAGRAAPRAEPTGLSWPLDPYARVYWWQAGALIAGMVYLGALLSTLLAEGVTDPLPYVPLLNPIDLSALLALAALALWRQVVSRSADVPPKAGWLCGGGGLGAGAVLAFAVINMVWLRTAHHWLGVDWSGAVLAESQIVQSGLSLLWTLIAMGLMLFAHRRAQRLPWLAGAVLLGAVVAKLVLVDMSKVEGIARIVAFIGVGVLMLLIGYFVPLPPRREEQAA